MFLQGYKLFAL